MYEEEKGDIERKGDQGLRKIPSEMGNDVITRGFQDVLDPGTG